ncbi:glycosyl hydrolase family cellulase [Pelomyxa schiedti]|nr:glycosyl hydrolase family cellulase [Pelomyxa schiedti]
MKTMGWLWVVVGLTAVVEAAIRVDNATKMFVDEYGRQRFFHGVNAVYKTDPYMPVTDYFDPQLSLCEQDMEDLWNWGMNAVRLGVMWPGVEPSKGQYDTTYLSSMAKIASDLSAHGIYTIVDLHQDVYSRHECGEGVPDWATYIPADVEPFPAPLRNVTLDFDPTTGYPTIESCLLYDFFKYYFTKETGAVFQALYDNTNGIQTSWVNFWVEVAGYFKDIDGVLGYELINEPWAGDIYGKRGLFIPGEADRVNLAPMYEAANDAIRQIDDVKMLFFEKATVNVIGPTGLGYGPGGAAYSDRQVYSYHNYCGSVDEDGNPVKVMLCDGEEDVQWQQEMRDIENLGCGGFMTEFGAVSGNSSIVIRNLNFLMDLTDKYQQSWAYWQFKKYNDFTTVNGGESFYSDDGTIQTEKVAAITRAYPQAIAGTINSYQLDRATGKLTVDYNINKAISQPTDIYVNVAMNYPKGVKVSMTPDNVATYSYSNNHVHITPLASTPDGTNIVVTVTESLL